MAPRKKIVYDTNTGMVSVHGIKHNKDGIRDQAMDGVAYDPDSDTFTFRSDTFNPDWLRKEQVTLVVRQ